MNLIKEKNIRPVSYATLKGWHLSQVNFVNEFAENFKAYLRSAMAYTNCSTLDEFQSGWVTLNVMNNKCYNNIN